MSAAQVDEEAGLLSQALIHAPPMPDEAAHSNRVLAGFVLLVTMIGVPVLIGVLYMEGVI